MMMAWMRGSGEMVWKPLRMTSMSPAFFRVFWRKMAPATMSSKSTAFRTP